MDVLNHFLLYCLATKKTTAELKASRALPLCIFTHFFIFYATVAFSPSSTSPSTVFSKVALS